jgi:hypothetical protein
MTFRPNYRGQRAAKDRVREERKQAKLLKRQEDAAKRKAEREVASSSEEPQGG